MHSLKWTSFVVNDPTTPGCISVSGVLYRISGEYDKALESYDRSLLLNPAESLALSWGRARILMYQGRYDEALLELDQGAAIGLTIHC